MNVNWDRLRVFFAVAEAGSFTDAAKILRLSQPAVSRQISTLEREIDNTLFHRHHKGLVLTEVGEDVFKTTKHVLSEFEKMEERIVDLRGTPEGPLKVTTTVAFGSTWLSSRMNRFHDLYPQIRVSLLLVDDHEFDLSTRDADVAIRFSPQVQPFAVQTRLMKIQYHIFACRRYLERKGTPEVSRDLLDHDLIVYGDDVQAPIDNINWLLDLARTHKKDFEPALTVSSIHGIFQAVRSGMGIAALPLYLAEEEETLTEILPDCQGPEFDAYLVYLEEMRDSMRLRVLRQFLLNEAQPGRMQ